jgi:hypothetical protein
VVLPPRATPEAAPVATVRLDESIGPVIDELEKLLPPTEFRSSLIADLRASYMPGVGMAEAFGRWLERVLGDRGLIVYDSSDPASKPLVSEVFARELSMPGRTAKLAALAGSDLVARGYHSQVQTQDVTSDALFHLEGWTPHHSTAGRRVRGRATRTIRRPCSCRKPAIALRLQPQRAAAAGRAGYDFSDHLLRRRP